MDDETPRRIRRRFTLEEKHAALDMRDQGIPLRELGPMLGVNYSTLQMWAGQLNRLKRDNPDAVWTIRIRVPDRDEALAALAVEGCRPQTIEAARDLCFERAAQATSLGDGPATTRWTRMLRHWEWVIQTRRRTASTRKPRDVARIEGARPRNLGTAWAPHEAQRPPEGEWRTWLFMGGRGAGKTRAGAEWLAAAAEADSDARLALVGPTLHDVREVMMEGASGLLNLPGRERPRYEKTRRRLVWSNGAVAQGFSAEDPESLRGPQFTAAWVDELCVWPDPSGTLALLRLGMRLGRAPRLVVTTTPKPLPALRALIAEPGCVLSRAGTSANAENLSPAFLEGVEALYGGTRLAAQEIEGVLVEAEAGALWRAEELARCGGAAPDRLDRVVVAVDPPASAGGDACGIVVAGRRGERAYVLADRTARGLSPLGWAQRAAAAAAEWRAHAIVAEANQGGDMVRSTLATAAPSAKVILAHATRSKGTRAEPVAALYEQGRVTHCGAFPALEEELMALGAVEGPKSSPDRADALVWALTELMLGAPPLQPSLRAL